MSLINRTSVKTAALQIAADTGRERFVRVSGEFLDCAECELRRWLTAQIRSHPSIGKTVYPSTHIPAPRNQKGD